MPPDNLSTGAFVKTPFASYTQKTLVRLIAGGTLVKEHYKTKSLTPITPAGETYQGLCHGYVLVDFKKPPSTVSNAGWKGNCNSILEAVIAVDGNGTAERPNWNLRSTFYPCGGTNQPACYKYVNGSHTVQLIPTAQTLQLVASPGNVTTGSTVRFTARRSDGGSFTVQSWTWRPMTPVSDPGATTATKYGPSASGCSTGTNICDALMTNTETSADTTASPQRGIMYVQALVNGVLETAKAEVTVARGQLRLRADPAAITASDTVTFTPSTQGGQAFSVVSWNWVPDTLPGHSVSCGTATVCRSDLYETGTMFVTANVGGVNERASARVRVTPPRIQIELGAAEIRPAGAGGVNKTSVKVSVVRPNGGAIPNWTVNLGLIADAFSAGHTGPHKIAKPKGSLPTSVVTGANGVGTVTYSATVFSGPVTIQGTAAGADTGTATVRIRVPGLAALQFHSAMEATGSNNIHPSNHWGTPAMNESLRRLATALAKYRQDVDTLPLADRPDGTWPPLGVNDMSLEDGGKFDLDSAWASVHQSHKEHRRGQEADVRARGPSQWNHYARMIKIIWIFELGGDVHDERATTSPHLHLRLSK